MTALLLLVACGGPWTRDAALVPFLAQLDRDHDGHVGEAEYRAVAYNGPEFAAADADGDGTLDVGELGVLLAVQDPVAFQATRRPPGGVTRQPVPPPPAPADGQTPDNGGGPARLRLTGLFLHLLRDEVTARDPAALPLTDAEIRAVDGAGGLDTPQARAAFATLQAAFDRAGLTFPPSLRQ